MSKRPRISPRNSDSSRAKLWWSATNPSNFASWESNLSSSETTLPSSETILPSSETTLVSNDPNLRSTESILTSNEATRSSTRPSRASTLPSRSSILSSRASTLSNLAPKIRQRKTPNAKTLAKFEAPNATSIPMTVLLLAPAVTVRRREVRYHHTPPADDFATANGRPLMVGVVETCRNTFCATRRVVRQWSIAIRVARNCRNMMWDCGRATRHPTRDSSTASASGAHLCYFRAQTISRTGLRAE